MIALLQRAARAHVVVDRQTVGEIGPGLLVLLCAERGDTMRQGEALLARMLAYRMFPDDTGRMNRSLADIGGGLLLVPQFTLAADTRSGLRPSFTPAAPPEEARRLFDEVAARAIALHRPVATGVFGADMQVHLVNDGPVTFWLRVDPLQ
ncbi:MAG: D-aminoacyl-tRNA deacylase [Burkholderiales bacterium]|jgi:D-tyrosyl-tRNA(Tyr) deacylase|nr:D-aminoacyl-tRNA deacylase [Burkholderiales bacterium]